MNPKRHVKIFDTTLRDGQQCPGAGMSAEKNLEYARLARLLRVDVLEAGFPSASALDFNIVHEIAADYAGFDQSPIVAALCQLRREQIDKTVDALRPAIERGRARLHTYVPVSPELMAASLGDKADKQRIIEDLFINVQRAVEAGCEVQFSPEGYSRVGENFDFCTQLIRAAVAAGAAIINCPDTIGGACRSEGEQYFVNNMRKHAEIIACEFPNRDIRWSVHCHNDFGLAVSNSVTGVFEGPATQIEGCINGIGERAGNAALEQCIMLIKHFGARCDADNPYFTTIDTEHLQAVSDFVGRNMLPRQPHWPVCGENAARHSSGGHTNAILRNPLAYQPFDPGEVGKQVALVFGPLSGGNHAQSIIRNNGFICEDEEKATIAQFIKDRFHQRRKGITDAELISAYFDFRAPMTIDRIDYARKDDRSQVEITGTYQQKPFGVRQTIKGRDSALAALKMVLEQYFGNFEILAHWSESESAGVSAVSKSHIEIVDENKNRYVGAACDQDIEISAMKALVDACNRCYVMRKYTSANIENLSQSAEMPKAVRLSAAS